MSFWQTRGAGILVLSGLGVLILAIIGFSIGMEYYGNYSVHNTWFVAGDNHRFDPVAGYAGIHKFAGKDMQLVKMTAKFVRPDGTMDLYAKYQPTTVYNFAKSVEVNLPPVGAGRTQAQQEQYSHTTVTVYDPSTYNLDVYRRSYRNYGMQKTTIDNVSMDPGLSDKFVEAPRCSFADLWKQAIAHGAPKDAVATITYDQTGYAFQIPDVSFSAKFDGACTWSSLARLHR